MLSARTDSTDKVHALDRGADDYVTKPFGVDELRPACAPPSGAPPPPSPRATADEPVDAGDLTIDLAAKKVCRRRAAGPPHPHRVEHPRAARPQPRQARQPQRSCCTTSGGPADRKETSYLRVYLAQLRRKLERDPAHPQHLITEAGMGYRFRT